MWPELMRAKSGDAPALVRALRVKAAEVEDTFDLAVFDARADEPSRAFVSVLGKLKVCGKL